MAVFGEWCDVVGGEVLAGVWWGVVAGAPVAVGLDVLLYGVASSLGLLWGGFWLAVSGAVCAGGGGVACEARFEHVAVLFLWVGGVYGWVGVGGLSGGFGDYGLLECVDQIRECWVCGG